MAAILYQKVEVSGLEQQVVLLKQKYLQYFEEIAQVYPLKWNIEKDDTNYLKPNTTMASSKLENDELKIWFFLHHIEAELNYKHSITNYTFFEKVSLIYLEFILLHELKHLQQFCDGLTTEKYKAASNKYEDNPYEKEANEFALELIKADSEDNYELLQYMINGGKFNIYNQNEWNEKIN
ncbi:ImmA/IrrE family metallo-endopeptidase [Lysinibacillus sp. FSL M8-0134]|uniref:ImmA/IrrE family metallo-endopeptidase n=1 Tax=Lysinibacillus sp. FSL M8-0134 TaxID=2921717 RepID=UPI0031191684